jgi:hypothetical protein
MIVSTYCSVKEKLLRSYWAILLMLQLNGIALDCCPKIRGSNAAFPNLWQTNPQFQDGDMECQLEWYLAVLLGATEEKNGKCPKVAQKRYRE